MRLTSPYLVNRLVRNTKNSGKLRTRALIRKDQPYLSFGEFFLIEDSAIRHAGSNHLFIQFSVVVDGPLKPAALALEPVTPKRRTVSPVVRRGDFPESVSAIVSHSSAE